MRHSEARRVTVLYVRAACTCSSLPCSLGKDQVSVPTLQAWLQPIAQPTLPCCHAPKHATPTMYSASSRQSVSLYFRDTAENDTSYVPACQGLEVSHFRIRIVQHQPRTRGKPSTPHKHATPTLYS